jgi:hypothetical protein
LCVTLAALLSQQSMFFDVDDKHPPHLHTEAWVEAPIKLDIPAASGSLQTAFGTRV